MLSHADNEAICRVGKGTPMGDLMREYWVPFAVATELEPDCDPVRIMLLGQRFLAIRTTSGTAVLMDEFCPHRGASMWYGRNENEGIRCVYHGWKFDGAGSCVDMPNEPVGSNFKDKVRLPVYPVAEAGGLVWAYLGPRATPPPLPAFEWFDDPEVTSTAWAFQRECNWLQLLRTGGGGNYGKYSNPEVDALLLEAVNTTDEQKRTENYKQVQLVAGDDLAIGWYSRAYTGLITRNAVKGIVLDVPTGPQMWATAWLSG